MTAGGDDHNSSQSLPINEKVIATVLSFASKIILGMNTEQEPRICVC